MADEDILTDEERDEEERKRKAQPDSIGTPIAPENARLLHAASGMAGAGPAALINTESAKLPDTLAPPVTRESVGTPIQGMQPAAAPRPNYDRYQQQLHNKAGVENLHGFGGGLVKGLEAIGTALAPNRMAMIPGTRLHHEGQVEHARTAAQEENTTITNESEEQLREAQAEEQRALAKKNAAGPPEKWDSVAQLHAHAVRDAQSRGVDPATDPHVLQIEDAIQRIQKQAPQKPDTATQEDQKYEDIRTRQQTKKPVTPEEVAWAQAYEKRKTLGPALTANAAAGRQDKSFEQQEKMFHLREQALTAPTKSMIEAAPTVDGLASRIDPLIDKLDTELGPGSGRWTEFWAGKVGTKDPVYSKLRTDVSLLQTALMRMHVGAKGGDQMMAHFKDIIDQGKQDPDNMRAALSEIRQYVHDLKAKGIAGGMSPAVLNSGEGGGTETQVHNGFEYTKGADGQWHKGKRAQ